MIKAVELKEDIPWMGLRYGDRFDSRNFYISEDALNIYIHDINVDTGFSKCNLTLPQYTVIVERSER